jgi:hypothetical protein
VNLFSFSSPLYLIRIDRGKTPPNINKRGNIEEATLSIWSMESKELAFSWLIMLQPVRSRKSADFLGDHRMPKGLVFDLFLSAWLLAIGSWLLTYNLGTYNIVCYWITA